MNKRSFLGLICVASCWPAFTAAGARENADMIAEDGVAFAWRHEGGRLRCRFMAPTRGWLAVGFNDVPQLKGTRFVIASRAAGALQVEERLAIFPDHKPISELGWRGAVADPSLVHRNDASELRFAYPTHFADQPDLRLHAGAEVFLMLAWSMAPDFVHHSAWRKHYPITL